MHPLQRLLVSNRGRGFFRADAGTADEATLYLYDTIVSDELTAEWWGGVAPQSFVKALLAIDAPVIHLRINSPGGDVFAGRVIEQAIREAKATVIAHVDGYAASAASYVALAADEVVIAPGGFFMIHKAWSIGYGNSDDLMQLAGLLDKIDSTLVDTYVAKTGQERQQIIDWMSDETWFTADEAVAAGFADRIAECVPKASAKFDVSAYANAPEGASAGAVGSPPAAAAAQREAAAKAHTDHLRRRIALIEKTTA